LVIKNSFIINIIFTYEGKREARQELPSRERGRERILMLSYLGVGTT
jgi:hypothetical protein